MKQTLISQKKELLHNVDICLSATWLKNGSESQTITIDKINANATVRIDSLKNCMMSCFLKEPTVLRMPTSFARFSLFAVLKFMKFMQASNSTNKPIMPNIQTYCIPPPVFTPFLNSEYKCHLLIGCKNKADSFFCSCG